MANTARVEIIILNLSEFVSLEETISIKLDAEIIDIGEDVVGFRTKPGEASVWNDFQVLKSDPEFAASLSEAIRLDYEPGGHIAQYPISTYPSTNTTIIEATEYGHSFSAVEAPIWASVVIFPEVLPPSSLDITTITASEADGIDKCGTVRFDFEVENDVPADYPIQILQPVSKIATTANDLYFDYSRFPVPTVSLLIESNLSVQSSKVLQTVSTYSLDNIDILESLQGATVTMNTSIVNNGDTSLNLTYSIDDATYNISNIFYGILPGSYTAYSLDQFGCKQSTPFTVVGIVIDKPNPIYEYLNADSLKWYKKQTEEFDGKTTFPNFDNSPISQQLYFNTEHRCYTQLVQTNDIKTHQLRTNYDDVVVNVRRCKDDAIALSPTAQEVVPNINKEDKRDCFIKKGISGKTNVYFTGVSPNDKVYEPGTTTEIDTYINPNLLLPEFADPGTIDSGITITLSGNSILNGTFSVEESVYDEDIKGQAFQFNAVFNDVPTAAICQSLYNALDYNIWEFSVNWGALELPVGNYYIQSLGTDPDPRYDDREWLTEPIVSSDEVWKGSTYIEYSNSENYGGLDYSTELVNCIRIPARFVKYRNGGDKEVFEDSQGNIEPLKEVIVRDISIETSLLPQYIQEKIEIIIGHDTIKINGLEGNFLDKSEIEDLFDEQNMSYKSVAVFRLKETTTIIAGGGGVVSDEGVVLGADAGFVIGV
ncbi:MAG: hypothetical protein GY928_14640 [Colwellia sp.]|nr:hypothetical protein [Colwellia sp.]